jgi:Family of unknown function (DUF6174)
MTITDRLRSARSTRRRPTSLAWVLSTAALMIGLVAAGAATRSQASEHNPTSLPSTTAPGTPSAPRRLTATVADGSVTLSWRPPSNPGAMSTNPKGAQRPPAGAAAAAFDSGDAGADDEVVIQITTGGGISGPCCSFWDLPEVTVYGDGTAVVVEAGGGQLPAITTATLDWRDVVEVFATAEQAGVFGTGVDPGAVCCDMAYTRFVIAAADDGFADVELEVSGLGLEPGGSELTAEQRRLRAALVEVRERLVELVAEAQEHAAYVPQDLAVLVAPPRDEPASEPPPWPLEEPLADGLLVGPGHLRCVSVTGEDVLVVLDAFADADAESNVWMSDGEPWSVFVRPLLPHEHGCPEGDPWALARSELSERRTQWILSGAFDNYQLVVTAHCFCPTDYTIPRRVTVVDGDVASVEPEPPVGFTMPLTVDDLFDLVEQGFDDADAVDVTYDDVYGFPTTIAIDWDAAAVDEQSAYEVTEFTTSV